jgi:hypothetical protein
MSPLLPVTAHGNGDPVVGPLLRTESARRTAEAVERPPVRKPGLRPAPGGAESVAVRVHMGKDAPIAALSSRGDRPADAQRHPLAGTSSAATSTSR